MIVSRMRRCLATAGLIGTLLFATGCASPPPKLTLTSLSNSQTYRQPFTRAYASRQGGDLDVVLLDAAAEQVLAGTRTAEPVHQMMHIRVLWQPTREVKAEQPCNTNATLHWYVVADPHSLHPGVLEYAGTGFVSFSESKGTTEVSITNATLKPTANRGLTDPVGPSRVQGTVLAKTDDARVEHVLAGMRNLAADTARVAADRLASTARTVPAR